MAIQFKSCRTSKQITINRLYKVLKADSTKTTASQDIPCSFVDMYRCFLLRRWWQQVPLEHWCSTKLQSNASYTQILRSTSNTRTFLYLLSHLAVLLNCPQIVKELLFFDTTITFGYKVQVNVQVKVFLKHAMQVQSGNCGTALLTLNLSTKGRWVVNTMPWPLQPPETAPIPTVQEPG